MNIHPTAIVSPQARLGSNVTIGPFSIIEDDVEIQADTLIGPHVVVYNGTRLGSGCQVAQGAAVGQIPQDLKYEGEQTFLEVGDRTQIREFASLHRGTKAAGATRIGSDCLIMAYVHVAHDCLVGNNVILANAVTLAGHCTVEDWVSIGGMTPVRQFARIGQHAYVGGAVRVIKDIPPFILAIGEPARYTGLNQVGLTRRGFSKERLRDMKEMYKIIYNSEFNTSQALEELAKAFPDNSDMRLVHDFISGSELGIL